jgi:hypothetical protein
MSKNDEIKIRLEKETFKYFIDKLKKTNISLNDISMGEHTKKEPDILYKNKGIELGAIISGTNKMIDDYEVNFIKRMNELAKDKIPHNYKIPLLFQQDKEYEIYKTLDQFKDYKYITKYLSKLYIERYDYSVNEQFVLAQNNLMQIQSMFPNIKKDKELNLLIDEIVDFFQNIDNYTFHKFPANWNSQDKEFLNQPIWNRKTKDKSKIVIAKEGQILERYFPKKIIEKFQKDKYIGNFNEKILLLHNQDNVNSIMSTDYHFYCHYKNHIFNKIDSLIQEYNSFNIYDKIYFADFSSNIDKKNVDIIDFSNYKKRKADEVLEHQRHTMVKFI